MSKRTALQHRSKLHPMQRGDTVFGTLVVDTVGILPKSTKNNCYIFTCINAFSRYTFLIPIPNLTTESVANALLHIFADTALPRKIISDNFSSFLSTGITQFYKTLNIQVLHSSPLMPRSTAACERIHRDLNNCLRCLLKNQATHENWENCLPMVAHALRTAESPQFPILPHELVHGFTARTLLEADLNVDDSIYAPDALTYIKLLREKVQIVRDTQLQINKAAEQHMQDRYDKEQARPFAYQQGDYVYLRQVTVRPNQATKLVCTYTGPYLIEKLIRDTNVLLRNPKTDKVFSRLIHVNRLKKCNVRVPITTRVEPTSQGDVVFKQTNKSNSTSTQTD
jgi:hypothetical protein